MLAWQVVCEFSFLCAGSLASRLAAPSACLPPLHLPLSRCTSLSFYLPLLRFALCLFLSPSPIASLCHSLPPALSNSTLPEYPFRSFYPTRGHLPLLSPCSQMAPRWLQKPHFEQFWLLAAKWLPDDSRRLILSRSGPLQPNGSQMAPEGSF